MKSKKIIIVLIIIIILLLIFGTAEVLRTHRTDNESLIKDDNATPWNGEQSLPRAARAQGDVIAIPGFDELVFIERQKEQAVNFYNPEGNDCLFLMTLFVNEKQVWKSGYVAPGNGYYQIELADELSKGQYSGVLRIQCFKSDGSELNSAKVNFNLIVIER